MKHNKAMIFAFFLSNLDGGIISYIDKKPPKMNYANISG